MAMPGKTAAHVVLIVWEVSRQNVQLDSLEIWKEVPAVLFANLVHQATTVRRERPTLSSCHAQPVDTAQQELQ